MKFALLCATTLGVLSCANGWSDTKKRSFPPGFLFGASSAAYQVEGAWDEDGKSESIWDRYFHDPQVTVEGYNGDVASDSYHNVHRDVELLRELGVHFYRFSISWPRVLPTGFPDKINEKAFQYYDSLIEELLKYKIVPMVTLYHFDLPQSLQDIGGWANPLSISWFEEYSRIVFDRYADKVKYWVTINQPNSICVNGYGTGDMAPFVRNNGIADYICVKNVLMAHAKVYRLYQREFQKKHQGSIGIAISVNWVDPLDLNSDADKKAAEKARAFTIGLYMDPIWSKEGGFPRIVKDAVARKSRQQGFFKSRLPELTAEEIKILKGSADFLGMNHYTTVLVTDSSIPQESPSLDDDLSVDFSQGKQWAQAKSPWLKSAPYGLYKALIHLNLQYDYPSIMITEHGWSTGPGLGDKSRADTINLYLKALLLAMEDGARVSGYTAWSLMDNVEWVAGTSERFGLYEVDFSHPNKTRTARLSAFVYKQLIETRMVDEEYTPDDLRIKITPKKKDKTEL